MLAAPMAGSLILTTQPSTAVARASVIGQAPYIQGGRVGVLLGLDGGSLAWLLQE